MFKVKPVFSEKIWGGSKLRDFGFDIPSDKTGEAWIVSAYEGNSSMLENGQTLREFYKNNRDEFNNFPSDEFPLLVKILDANDDLSVQVHPNDEHAQRLENYPFGKTECWYVLESKEDGKIQIGINAKNQEEARELIENSEWDKLLNKQDINRGDLFDIKAGTVHAILSGTVIYELQQSSDITYRIYDFDRVDDEGNKRELHIDKSLEVIDYESEVEKVQPLIMCDYLSEEDGEIKGYQVHNLINNEIYTLNKWIIKNDFARLIKLTREDYNFVLATVVEGEVTINDVKLKQYESVLITSSDLEDGITIEGNGEVLAANPNMPK